MEKRHFCDGLMCHPNNYNNIHLPLSLNSRTVFHVVPQGLCWTIAHLDIGRRLLGVHAQEAVQTVRPHNLQNTQDFGWTGITVFLTTGGMLPLDQSDSDWINHTDIQLFSYFHFFESIYCSYQTHVFFFQDFISSKGSFLWGGPTKLRNLFTTLLAITRLLDFEVTTLPYPTRSWKTTTRWGLVIRQREIHLHPYSCGTMPKAFWSSPTFFQRILSPIGTTNRYGVSSSGKSLNFSSI